MTNIKYVKGKKIPLSTHIKNYLFFSMFLLTYCNHSVDKIGHSDFYTIILSSVLPKLLHSIQIFTLKACIIVHQVDIPRFSWTTLCCWHIEEPFLPWNNQIRPTLPALGWDDDCSVFIPWENIQCLTSWPAHSTWVQAGGVQSPVQQCSGCRTETASPGIVLGFILPFPVLAMPPSKIEVVWPQAFKYL